MIEYEVETIISAKKKQGKMLYLGKWQGYHDHKKTWKSEDDLLNGKLLLDTYKASSDAVLEGKKFHTHLFRFY